MDCFLDTGILGLVTNPQANEEAEACNRWLEQLLRAGHRACVAEICDYELRRELLRLEFKRASGYEKWAAARARLDALKNALHYVPITTTAMLRAAELWAKARNSGRPTADDKALDADMILTAQVLTFAADNQASGRTLIATTNVGHLSLFAEAHRWNEITP
ncbi:MAG: PIN domain-containing protein [Planctomycetota bacterium]|nr:MAG: PIN domain-containing protein [Planctomycetota bacterium]